MRSILIFGATASMAQACIRVWAQQSTAVTFICVARDAQKLQAQVTDLQIRFPQAVFESHAVDFACAEALTQQIDMICERHPQLDQVLLAQGCMYEAEDHLTAAQLTDMLDVNVASVAVILNALYAKIATQTHTTQIAVIGSVAGDRGRKANYAYGASKAFVACYVEGLQHRIALEKSQVQLSLVKPGPTATAMTAHLTATGKKLASVDAVAAQIVTGMARGQRVIYTPKIWRIIMLIIRHIPFFIFKKLDI